MNGSSRTDLVVALVVLVMVGAIVGCSLPGSQPPTTPTGAAPGPTSDPFMEIDNALSEAISSSIAYNAPETMTVDESTMIELLMNPSASAQELATQVSQPGPVVTTSVEITPLMKAELIPLDPAAFTVQALHDNPIQVVGRKDTTRWQWSVTALKGGHQTLTLILYREIKFQGQDYWRSVKSYAANIDVQVTIGQRLATVDWKWFAGIVLAFATAAFWRWWDSRKKTEQGKQGHPAKTAKHADRR